MLLIFIASYISLVYSFNHASPGYSSQIYKELPNLQCSLSQDEINEIQSYQANVNLIIDAFTNGIYKGRTYDLLEELTDTFGSRMTGSQALESAIDWVLEKATDLDNVYTENVDIDVWQRNEESLSMVLPRPYNLHIVGLGSSIGTPPSGIYAEVLVVTSYDDLETQQDEVPGKIVLYDFNYTTYSEGSTYRVYGASRASQYGAVASLTRSLTDFSIQSPHTGIQFYDADITPIPTACITIEDSKFLRRLSDQAYPIWVNLTMGAENLENSISRNTILELTGKEIPDEYVLISGHMDSWDVGNGVIDDASGCVLAWTAARALKELNLTPRRTVQVVMFTSEEQGVIGGDVFFNKHMASAEKYQIMMEADLGIFDPSGIALTSPDEKSYCIMQEILSLLSDTNMTQLLNGTSSPDILVWSDIGVPIAEPITGDTEYFWYHHSEGDNMEVVDSDELDQLAALWTSVSYVLADLSFRLN